MMVTQIEPVGKTKGKVYIDYEFAFIVSVKQLKMFDVMEGNVISEEIYAQIINEILLPKARLKAMDLLKTMDRTEQELLTKLRATGFSDLVCQDAINYVKQYNYINDFRYACNYIKYRKSGKSLRMLQMELSRKGVEKDLIIQAIEEEYQEGAEEEAIRREVRKKCKSIEDLTFEKRIKISASLFRKGFSSATVRKVLGDLSFYDE